MAFEDLVEQIVVYLAIAALAALGGFFATMRRCVTNIDKRTFRQSTAIMTIAEDMQKTTNRLHSDEDSTLAKTIERQLKDSKGNL